jgi:hypothetical protein
MQIRFVLTAAIVLSGLIGSPAPAAHGASGRREGPKVTVSTVRDSAPAPSLDAEVLEDLDCEAERATAQAKLAKRLAGCVRQDSRRSGFDLRTCRDESFRKYLEATSGLSCDGASDVVGTYTCQGVLCTCHGDDCEEMFEDAGCGDVVSCEMSGDEAVCSCLPPL